MLVEVDVLVVQFDYESILIVGIFNQMTVFLEENLTPERQFKSWLIVVLSDIH